MQHGPATVRNAAGNAAGSAVADLAAAVECVAAAAAAAAAVAAAAAAEEHCGEAGVVEDSQVAEGWKQAAALAPCWVDCRNLLPLTRVV